MFAATRRHSILAIPLLAAAICALGFSSGNPAGAQQPAGRTGPMPDDTAGFQAIFDGSSLDNWDGDPMFWRAENSEIIGESTAEKVVKVNTFLIWKGGPVRNFELKADFRLSPNANSGIQYRSALLPEVARWSMRGYQADLDGRDTYTGQLYEERGRGFLAMRGQFTRMLREKPLRLVASLGESAALKEFIKPNDWNQIHIVANGNTLIHAINGHVMAAFLDEDPGGAANEGLLGLQLHAGQPMKNEFRNIYYKKLP